MGATGSGKSALASTLAQQLPCAIISCDSMQIYRNLDIGTAKPTSEEQQQIPHELIDCLTLPQQGNAVWWAEQARVAIHRHQANGRIPLIVGGTGMYLRALLEGFADIPAESATIHSRLTTLQQMRGTPWLHRMLQRVDPMIAQRLPAHDSQRILRALGVAFSSGKPLSYWHKQQPQTPSMHCAIFVLDLPRDTLYPHLEQRFHSMLGRGWLDEIAWLDRQRLAPDHPAERAVGYRQLLTYVRGACERAQAVQRGIFATRQYAKRQQTWFRHQTPNAVHGDYHTILRHTLTLGRTWN
ncbi:MAG: tRNA (adenosine(37)-N6)-dimethylallyltransferase MiaA [Mariprofundales bacterium]